MLGELPAAELGPVDYHEHLFQVSPLLPGDELTDRERSGAEAAALRAAGIGAMVEATPTGLGRDPVGVAGISARTGLHVVAATGAHRAAHYRSGHWLLELDEARLLARFTAEVTTGLPASDQPGPAAPAAGPRGAPIRAGLVKAGIGYWSIGPFERRVLAAAAGTAAATGVPVMVHLEHGSAAAEVLALLAADGVPADRVVLAHIDRNPDPGLHAELAAAGAYLGYDGMARHRQWPDSVLLDCLVAAADRGAAARIVLGGDVARASRYVAYGGMPGLAYLPTRFVPRLRALGGAELVHAVLVANPARLLTRRGPI